MRSKHGIMNEVAEHRPEMNDERHRGFVQLAMLEVLIDIRDALLVASKIATFDKPKSKKKGKRS